jgi:hypothetical protein
MKDIPVCGWRLAAILLKAQRQIELLGELLAGCDGDENAGRAKTDEKKSQVSRHGKLSG